MSESESHAQTPDGTSRIEQHVGTVKDGAAAVGTVQAEKGSSVQFGGQHYYIFTDSFQDDRQAANEVLTTALKAKRDIANLDSSARMDQMFVDPDNKGRSFNPHQIYSKSIWKHLQESDADQEIRGRILELMIQPHYTVGEFASFLDQIIAVAKDAKKAS